MKKKSKSKSYSKNKRKSKIENNFTGKISKNDTIQISFFSIYKDNQKI